MFERPAKRDIDSFLSVLMHDARHQLAVELNQELSAATLAGALLSNRLVVLSAAHADKIHRASMDKAVPALRDFVERMEEPATRITEWARPHLENLSRSLFGVIKPRGFPEDLERLRKQYMAVFQQRVDLTLRNVEIGYVKEAGFSTRSAMSEGDWISAADALALFGKKHDTIPVTQMICKRAHAGLIRARAERFIRAGQVAENVDVPKEFWWAEGHDALEQNWEIGDFETWIANQLHLRAFGVCFLRADIEKLIPKNPSTEESAPQRRSVSAEQIHSSPLVEAPAPPPSKPVGGRPRAEWWDDLWIEICRQLYVGDLKPKRQADIEKAMNTWLSEKGDDAAVSTIRDRARKLWNVIGKDEN